MLIIDFDGFIIFDCLVDSYLFQMYYNVKCKIYRGNRCCLLKYKES